jgi:hypothetical protein
MELLRKFNIDTYVTPKISKMSIMKKIYESQRAQIDIANNNIQDLINNIFIDTATWALDDWEYELGIPTIKEDSYENRRARIKAKLRGYGTCTKKHIKNVCASFNYANDIDVTEHYEDYFFQIVMNSYNGFPKSMDDLYSIVREISPAHLGIHYSLRAITKSNLFLVCAHFTGEVIKVYPWTPNNIVYKVDVEIPLMQDKSLENIKIYPKEA